MFKVLYFNRCGVGTGPSVPMWDGFPFRWGLTDENSRFMYQRPGFSGERGKKRPAITDA